MTKSILLSLLLYSLFVPSASSQEGGAIDDPVFYVSAANNIQYPVGAIRNSIYGRIFASFEIDSAGTVRNVNVIYPLMDKKAGKILGFEEEIKAGLSKMPRLRTKDQGKYILPVAFAYTNVYHNTLPTTRPIAFRRRLFRRDINSSTRYRSRPAATGTAPCETFQTFHRPAGKSLIFKK